MRIALLMLLAVLGGCASAPPPQEIWVIVQGSPEFGIPVRLGRPLTVVQVKVEPLPRR